MESTHWLWATCYVAGTVKTFLTSSELDTCVLTSMLPCKLQCQEGFGISHSFPSCRALLGLSGPQTKKLLKCCAWIFSCQQMKPWIILQKLMNVIILEMNYVTVVSSKAECKILVLVLETALNTSVMPVHNDLDYLILLLHYCYHYH